MITTRPTGPSTEAVQQALRAALRLPGAMGCCVSDLDTRLLLGASAEGVGFAPEEARLTGVALARVLEAAGLLPVEDVVLTTAEQHHVVRTTPGERPLVLYVTCARGANLPLARVRLQEIAQALHPRP